jgi:hypothetical protein
VQRTLSKAAVEKLKNTHAKKPDGPILVPKIERHVLKSSHDRDGHRDTAHLHPTEMVKDMWCPQHSYFRMVDTPTEKIDASPSFRMESAFTEGHSSHKKWQTWLSEMGVLWGVWRCACSSRTFGAFTPFDRCGLCHEHWTYDEVPFYDKEYMIMGHADGLVILPEEGSFIIEIKTVGIGTLRFEAPILYEKLQTGVYTIDQTWAAIRKPFASHRMQAQFYLWLLKRQYPEFAGVSEVIFIYEWKASGAVKEFRIRAAESVIEERLEMAREVANHVSHDLPYLDRPEWAAADGLICQTCEYRTTCWNLEEPDATAGAASSGVTVRRSTGRTRRTVVAGAK